MRRLFARSVSPDEVMSAIASAVRLATVPSVAPWLSAHEVADYQLIDSQARTRR